MTKKVEIKTRIVSRFIERTPTMSESVAFFLSASYLALTLTNVTPMSQYVSNAVKNMEAGISLSTARAFDGCDLRTSNSGSS